MEHILSGSLTGWPATLSKGGDSQTSEIRGGKYAARIQTGYEKDGSPKYRYFKTQEEYEQYLKGSGKGKKKKGKDVRGSKHDDESGGEERLESKRKDERKEGKKKQQSLMTAAAKKTKNVETTKKSLPLYLKVG